MNSPPDSNAAAEPSTVKTPLATHALPLILVFLSTLCAIMGTSATEWLRYDRSEILNGQWWRIITGNIVHLGWPHLLLNLAGLILVWLLFHPTLTTRNWIIVTALSAAAVGGGLLAFDPALQWYVGLSGLLHGLFAAGVISALYAGNRSDWLLLTLFIAKIAWEQLEGSMPGSAEIAGGKVIVDAHLYGAIGGAVTVLVLIALTMRRRRHA